MKEIEVKIQLKNNLIKQRRVDLKMTQKQLAQTIGTSQGFITECETFKVKPVHIVFDIHKETRQETINYYCQKLANFFDCELEEIFPEWIKEIKSAKKTVYTNYSEIMGTLEHLSESPDMIEDKLLREISIKEEINKVLSQLPPREEKIIKMRFGIDGEDEQTLEEIGDKSSVSRTRIHQIEAKALRHLRDSKFRKQLSPYI